MLIISKKHINGIEVIAMESGHLRVELAPAAGGKIISVYNKHLGKEFLWRNENLLLKAHQTGADYDANFFGGIDELLPNDIPETIDSIAYPDHGELWTTQLDYELDEGEISVYGTLALSGLYYKKTMYLEMGTPVINITYTIRNDSGAERNFLWKLHAALNIEGGEQLITSAKKAKIVDPDYSRFKDTNEFNWPVIENTDASLVPGKENTVDFFYLYDIHRPEMSLLNEKKKHLFGYRYDKNVFPYQWYFASYGAFLNHYTVVLEPTTSMPISVNDAKQLRQSAVLKPGEEINTVVRIYAGENL